MTQADNRSKLEHIDPEDKKLPKDVALKVLDIADANDWGYAPMLDGCFSREEMESHLDENPEAAIALIINYEEDYADSIDVSMRDGKILLELEDNFYYKNEFIESLDTLKDTAWKMLTKYNNQPQ